MPVFRSVCAFSDLMVKSGPPGAPIVIRFTLNTSLARLPFLYQSHNDTIVVLADCPSSNISYLHTIISPRTNLTEADGFVTLVKGFYYSYADRNNIVCALGVVNETVAVSAVFVDMCTLRCGFPSKEFPQLFARPYRGPLRLVIAGKEALSLCPGNSANRSFFTGRWNRCAGLDGGHPCEIAISGGSVTAAVFTPSTMTTTYESLRLVSIDSELEVTFCDAANNTIVLPVNSTYLQGPSAASTTEPILATYISNNFQYGVKFRGITTEAINSACGPAFDVVMLQTRTIDAQSPSGIFTASYCIGNARSGAASIADIRIVNEEEIPTLADDAGPLPVALRIAALSWDGLPIVGQTTFDVNVSVVSSNFTVLSNTLFWNVSLATTPIELVGVSMPLAGSGFGLVVTSGASSSVLWGDRFPALKNITVDSCRAFSKLLQIASVTMNVEVSPCGGNTTSVASNRIRASPSLPTVATVAGWRFDYATKNLLRCHYSSFADQWNPETIGWPVVWISTCRLECTVPPQLHPIGAASPRFIDTNGIVRAKAAFPQVSVGHLRVFLGVARAWSNPIAVDVVGSAWGLAMQSWGGVMNTFSRSGFLTLPPATVLVTDILGTPLLLFDESPDRPVTITTSQSAAELLNQSLGVLVSLRTCRPASGEATATIVLIEPVLGSYTLVASSAGLTSVDIPLVIVQEANLSYFIRLVDPKPLGFTVAVGGGALPVQPHIIAINASDGMVADVTISDTTCSAVVILASLAPGRGTTTATTSGINVTSCVPQLGNCVPFLKGEANFSSLAFTGIAGGTYTVIISAKQASNSVSFNVTVADCDNVPAVLTEHSAKIVSQPFTSLIGPSGGIMISGWDFDPLAPCECWFNGTVFPAVVRDRCTMFCMTGAGTNTCSSQDFSNSSCCFDGARGICSRAVGDNVTVVTGASRKSVSAGLFDFIGLPRQIAVMPNSESPQTVGDGFSSPFRQLMISEEKVVLDGIIVGAFDRRGKFVGSTMQLAAPHVVTLSKTLKRIANDLAVPSIFPGTRYDTNTGSTCFSQDPGLSGTVNFTDESVLQCTLVNGSCTFANLFLTRPLVGLYRGVVTSSQLAASDSLLIHIVSGPPVRLCLVTDYSGSTIPRPLFEMRTSPQIFMLDAIGNLFQSVAVDPLLRRNAFISAKQRNPTLQGLSANVTIERRLLAELGSRKEWTATSNFVQIPVTHESLLVDGNFSIQQFAVASLTFFDSRYGFEYRATFACGGLVPVTTPPLQLEPCGSAEFGNFNESACESCPVGFNACDGPNPTCFSCNGSLRLNVSNGYWRYGPMSLTAYACPQASCIGSTELGDCAVGYKHHEPLCAVCDDGYAADFLGNCVKCDKIEITLVLFILACVGAVAVITFLVFLTVNSGNDDDNTLILIVKICVNFVQTSGTIGQFTMKTPDMIKQFLGFQHAASGGNGISISPFSCLSPHSTYMDKLRFQLLGPICALFIVAAAVKVVELRHPQSPELRFGNLYALVMMVLLFLIYQTMVSLSIGGMRCRIIIGDASRPFLRVLHSDVRIDCDAPQYPTDFAMAIFGVGIYGFGIPALAMILVLHHARRKGWEDAYKRFTFIIGGYKLRCWFWEVVILARKVALLLLLSTVHDPTLQALLGIWVLMVAFVLNIRNQPFVKRVLNKTETLALLTQVITLNVGLFQSIAGGASCTSFCLVVSVFLIAINCAVFVYFTKHLLREAYNRALQLFGSDVVLSDNRRYLSYRNMKKALLLKLKLKHRLVPSFTVYTPLPILATRLGTRMTTQTLLLQCDDDDAGEDDYVEMVTFPSLNAFSDDLGELPTGIDAGKQTETLII